MKKTLLTIATLALLAGLPALTRAADTNSMGSSTNAPVKPYPLNYCLVSGDVGESPGRANRRIHHRQSISGFAGHHRNRAAGVE